MTRAQALDEIARLAEAFGITPAEIGDRLGSAKPGGNRFVRVLGTIGGVFVFAGLCALIGLQWDHLNSLARVTITLGPGVTAFVLAMLAAGEARRSHLVAPMLWIAAVLEPMGMLVAFDEWGSGGPWQIAALITSGTMVVQFTVALRRTGFLLCLFVTLFFATSFWCVVLDWIDIDEEWIALTLGLSLLFTGLHFQRGPFDRLTPLILFVGAVSALAGWFAIVESSVLEISFLGMACGTVFLGVARASRTLNVAGSLAILAYIGYYTAEYFADSMGWPLALMAFGVVLMIIGGVALKIDRRLRG